MKKVLTTPIQDEDIASLHVGDIVYLSGTLVTCRDEGHRRNRGRKYHALPSDGSHRHFSCRTDCERGSKVVGRWFPLDPQPACASERYEKEFLAKTGVKLVIGKGGMGTKTAQGCKESFAVHAVFPGGCAVIAAEEVEKIEGKEWPEFGMPEAFWILKVKEFGPLIISIDTEGNNLFEANKVTFHARKEEALAKTSKNIVSIGGL